MPRTRRITAVAAACVASVSAARTAGVSAARVAGVAAARVSMRPPRTPVASRLLRGHRKSLPDRAGNAKLRPHNARHAHTMRQTTQGLT